MRLFKRKQVVERAAPEISKRFLEQTKARDEIVRSVVERTSREVRANHLGFRMHNAMRGR
jgi:hypothetical protein